MATPEYILAETCSLWEHIIDLGESDGVGSLTHVRYGGPNEVDYFDLTFDGRVIRLFAVDAGEHQHDDDDYCECGGL